MFDYIQKMYLIDENKYIANVDESKKLVFSSCFFLVPAVYGITNGIYFYSVVSLLTFLCSANYWRNANYSYRRMMDVIVAKTSFFIYVRGGILYVPDKTVACSVLIGILYCYYMSNKYEHTTIWWKYHMMFHFLVACNKLIILQNMI